MENVNLFVVAPVKYKYIMKIIFVTIGLFLTFGLSAQYTISGDITDNSGKTIAFAQIFLHDTEHSTESDENGHFEIKDIVLGQYLLKVSLIGHEEYSKSIFIDHNINLSVVLFKKYIKLNDVNINATRASDKMPFSYQDINKEKIEQENTGEDIPYLLKHTPSVVTTSDAGAGIGYTGIRIRGTDPTRINVTINGIPLNDAESQQVYWVDLPDLAGSVESIQIQRGVGSSTNGAGAFGASVNVKTENIKENPYLSIDGALGSYNTKRIAVKTGTGLMNGKYSIDLRYSIMKSDGYIDRAGSALNSFFLSATKLFNNGSLKFNAIIGKEKTYQAWYGLPVQYNGIDSLRTYNFAGTDYFQKDPAYDNQVDDYTQNHFQLFYNKKINDNLLLNLATHYTKGSGFYEQYKVDEDLSEYFLDTTKTRYNDLVRRKWLDNDFYGFVYSLKYTDEKSDLIIGGAANRYVGDHFGVVDTIIGIRYAGDQVYYKNTGTKNDASIYAKYIYSITDKLNAYADLQFRHVDYKIDGKDDDKRVLDIIDKHRFFNPKMGLRFDFNKNLAVYSSFAIAQKEPNRVDYISNLKNKTPKPEKLYDFEFGTSYNTKSLRAEANIYNMKYRNQLVLNGLLDDANNNIRENVDKSHRLGFEMVVGAKITDFFEINANTTISKNKIEQYNEQISDWDTGEAIKITHLNTDISFSPSIIAGVGFSLDLLKIITSKNLGNLYLNGFFKYVGKQYLDNTMNENASLDAYNYANAALSYKIQKGKFKNIEIGFKINNILNKKYITNGWVGRIKSSGYDPTADDPYTSKDIGNIYHYMGLYPQALRNYMLRLKFDF